MVTISNVPYKVECYPEMEHTVYHQTSTTYKTSVPTENLPSITEETDEDLQRDGAGREGVIAILLEQDQDIGCCGIMPQRNGYSHITGKKSNKKTGSLKFRMGHLFSRKRQRIRSKEQKMDDRTFNDVASISDYDNSMTESDENQNQNGCHCQHNKAIKLPECRLLETKSETESESEYVSRRGSDLIISKAEDNEDEEESESGEEESEGDEEKIEDEDVEEEREESEEGSEGQEQDLSLIYCSCCTKEESDHECYSEHHGTDDKNVEATGDTHAICDYTNHVTPEYHVTERDHMTDGGPKAELSDSDDSESYHSDTIIEQVADANEVSGVECNITNMEAYQEYDNFADAFPGCDNSIKIQDTAGTRECNPSFTDYKALNDKPVGLVNAAYRLDISGSVYTSQVEQDVLGSVWKKMPLNDKPSGYNPTYPTCAAPSCSNARNQLHPSIHDSPFRVYNKNDTVCKSVSKLVGESSVIETQSTDSDSDRGAEAKLDYFCRSRTSHSSDSTTPSGHEKSHSTTPYGHEKSHSTTSYGHEKSHSTTPYGHERPHSTTPYGHERSHSTTPYGHEKSCSSMSSREEKSPCNTQSSLPCNRNASNFVSVCQQNKFNFQNSNIPIIATHQHNTNMPRMSVRQDTIFTTSYGHGATHFEPKRITSTEQDEGKTLYVYDKDRPLFTPPIITTSPLITTFPGFILGSGSPFKGGLLAASRDTPLKRICVFCNTKGCKECKPIGTKQRLKIVPKR